MAVHIITDNVALTPAQRRNRQCEQNNRKFNCSLYKNRKRDRQALTNGGDLDRELSGNLKRALNGGNLEHEAVSRDFDC